jgi:hypothetical protein
VSERGLRLWRFWENGEGGRLGVPFLLRSKLGDLVKKAQDRTAEFEAVLVESVDLLNVIRLLLLVLLDTGFEFRYGRRGDFGFRHGMGWFEFMFMFSL